MSSIVEKRALALCTDVCMISLVFSLQFCLLIFLYHVVVVFHFHVFSVLKISLIIACIIGVIAYRLAVYASFASIMKNNTATNLDVVAPYVTPQLATSVTASCINFVIIMILNLLYERVAIKITDMGEGPQQVFCVYMCTRQCTSSKFSTDKMWKYIKNNYLLFYRNSEDPPGV